jgi:PAS domain S-box-containing protein
VADAPHATGVVASPREAERLEMLRSYGILDTPPEEEFDGLCRLASLICGAPIAALGFVDAEREWFKAVVGGELREVPREIAFCAHAIREPGELFVVPDALEDQRFAGNPLVTGEHGIRFYAGAPLVAPDGSALGALCVVDREPRQLTASQEEALGALARQAMAQLELRRTARAGRSAVHEERDRAYAALDSLVRATPIGAALIDPELRFVQVNQRLVEIDGLSVEDHLGRTVGEVLPELAPTLEPIVRTVLASGDPVVGIELSGETAAEPGVQRQWVASYFPVGAADGPAAGVVAFVQEVTEERRLERRVRHILESVSDGFVSLDRNWRYTYVNAKGAELLGRKPGELEGKHIWTEFPDGVGQPFHRAYERVMATRAAETIEEHYEPWDKFFENRIYPLDDGGIAIYYSEITERKRAERELAFRAALLANVGEAVLCSDAAGNTTYWGAGAERLYGWTVEEAMGRPVAELLDLQWGEAEWLALDRELDERGVARTELSPRRRDGERVDVVLTVTRIEGAEPTRYLAVARDVSAERRAQRRLAETEERFRALVERLPGVVYTWDVSGGSHLAQVTPYVSPQAETMLGYRQEDFGARPELWLERVHPDDLPRMLEEEDSAVAAGEPFRVEYRFQARDGRWRWLRDQSVPVEWDEAGKPTLYQGVLLDVTAEKEAEAAVRRSEERLRCVLDGLGSHMFVGLLTPGGILVEANRSALELAGLDRDAVTGRPLDETPWFASSEDERERLREAIARAAAGEAVRYDAVVSAAGNRPVTIDFSLQPLLDDEGKVAFLVPSARDATERVEAEREVARLLEREREARAEAQAAARELGALLEISDVALAGLGTEDLLAELLRRVSRALAVDEATVLLLDESGERLVVHASHGLAAEVEAHVSVPVGSGASGKIAATRRPLVLERLTEADVLSPFLREKLASLAGVPLLAGGELLGVLHVGTEEPRRFGEREVRLLELVAERVATALERTRAADDVRRYADRLAALRRHDLAILAATPTGEVVQDAVEALRRLTGADRASFGRFDRGRRTIEVAALALRPGAGALGPPLGAVVSQDEGTATLIAHESWYVTDTEEVAAAYPTAAQFAAMGIRSVAGCPVLVGGEPRGTLIVSSVAPRAFEEWHRETLREVAAQIALALEQESLRAAVTAHAAELEARVEERIAELAEANAELEAFAYTVAHDLRAPLRAMAGFSAALAEDYGESFDAAGRDYLERIVSAAARMDELIRDLLAYARLSQAEIVLEPVALDAVVAEAVAQHESEAAATGARVVVAPGLPAVQASRATLVQVLSNLVGNALKFVVPGAAPVVRVRAEAQEGAVRLWVEDEGIGIPPEHAARVFRVFERLHGQEAYPGTGIGLAIVRKGIERMGGRVGVESEPESGSRFWIELPPAKRRGTGPREQAGPGACGSGR